MPHAQAQARMRMRILNGKPFSPHCLNTPIKEPSNWLNRTYRTSMCTTICNITYLYRKYYIFPELYVVRLLYSTIVLKRARFRVSRTGKPYTAKIPLHDALKCLTLCAMFPGPHKPYTQRSMYGSRALACNGDNMKLCVDLSNAHRMLYLWNERIWRVIA